MERLQQRERRQQLAVPPLLVAVTLQNEIVSLLRWRRYTAIHQEYVKKYQDGTLTPEEAQRIILVTTTYDMPLLLNYSLCSRPMRL